MIYNLYIFHLSEPGAGAGGGGEINGIYMSHMNFVKKWKDVFNKYYI